MNQTTPPTENKYAEGSAVYALAAPGIQLTVRRYVERVYYCTIANDPDHKDLVYFERELMSAAGQ
jgi:hypothetical protein